MSMVNASDYAMQIGLPLSLVRRYCREGILPHVRHGMAYLLDKALADEALHNYMQRTADSKPAQRGHKVKRRVSKRTDFLRALSQI